MTEHRKVTDLPPVMVVGHAGESPTSFTESIAERLKDAGHPVLIADGTMKVVPRRAIDALQEQELNEAFFIKESDFAAPVDGRRASRAERRAALRAQVKKVAGGSKLARRFAKAELNGR